MFYVGDVGFRNIGDAIIHIRNSGEPGLIFHEDELACSVDKILEDGRLPIKFHKDVGTVLFPCPVKFI